jgi:branched-chain amino acid transport system permease protein
MISIRFTGCFSPSVWRWWWKARSAGFMVRRASPIRCRVSLPAAPISASCSCRIIAPSLFEKTRLGSYLRAATENPTLVQAFGINVPVLLTLTYALGAGLAGFTGVLAAPIYQVSPLMGTNLIIVVFAVVVVGGMGSIMGAIVTGYMLGIAEGLTKVFYPEASNIVIFVIMAFVLLIRPAGLFGKDA